MTLENNRAPLLYHIKLCASFQSHRLSQIWVAVRKPSIQVKNLWFFVPRDLEIWWMTLKNNTAPPLYYIKQGWGQIRFIKYKYKYIFCGVSNTNTNTPAKIWSNTNTNTNTAHQIQIQIHNEAETKLPPFYRWHIKIYCIVRRLFYVLQISLKSVSKSLIYNMPTLVQIMAWRWVGNKPLFNLTSDGPVYLCINASLNLNE